MNDQDHSDGGRHLRVGQGVVAADDSTLSIRDIHYHNHNGPNRPAQLTLRELLRFSEMQGRERRVEDAHDGTCEWFVRTQEYSAWTKAPRGDWRESIIWVRGNAGAGKSTLMKFAVEHARETTPDELVLPHFFNARGQALEHSIEGMLRTLIIWVLDELPEAEVQQLFSAYRRRSSKEWSVPELERLLKRAVSKVSDRSITFYIDALDECEDKDVDRMLWVFCDIVKKFHESGPRIRVCLASRPYPTITFTNAIFLDLHQQDEHLADIHRYIKDRLQIGNSKIAITVRRKIRQRANGIFMWVVLVVDLLNTDFRNGNLRKLRDRLREIPDDLRSFFAYTLERYQEDRPAMLVCFRWLLFKRDDHNHVSEMWWIMQLGLGRPDREIVKEYGVLDTDAMKRQILSKTKGFVEFKRHICQFVHESVREFILQETVLLGAEHPSEFEATSHELLRNWWSAEVITGQPMVLGLVSERDRYGHIAYDNEKRQTLEKRPLTISAAEETMYHAEKAQDCGRDQAVWLNSFSHMTGPYVVTHIDGLCHIVYGLVSLLLYVDCDTLLRETQLEPIRRGRCDGLALGFKDITDESLCPALRASYFNGGEPFSKALVHIYLNLEPRSFRLQSLMQEEAQYLSLRDPWDPPRAGPLLDLAYQNEGLATFFLLALTPPSVLEPHLDALERMFKEDGLPHLVWVLQLIIEQELPSDAIDCMSPFLLQWVEIEELSCKDDPDLTTRASTLEWMGDMLRFSGVQLPD